jgi:hypothetical protein
MSVDNEKVDEMVLALLHLTMFSDHGATRAWKRFPWEVMDRLYAKGFISDPKSTAKSVWVSEEGVRRSEELFKRHFGMEPDRRS